MKAKRPSGCICLQAAARLLARNGYVTGPETIFKQLRELNWLDGQHANWKKQAHGLMDQSSGWMDDGRGYSRAWLTRQGYEELKKLLPHRNKVEEIDLGISNSHLGF